MKSAIALVIVAWLAESALPSPQVTVPQPEESPWTSTGLQANSMVENQHLFSPRMDYDQWTPLGRGDPLKNDPTYDYVPPVLERVHYWMDPSKRTPDPPLTNSGVLVLGSRTESAFATQPTTHKYQAFQSKESQADSRIDTSSLLDPFFKLMDVSQFNLNFNSNASHKPGRIQRPNFQALKQRPQQPPQALQRPPYTMLVPPPPPPPPVPQSTNFITTVRTQTTVPMPPTSHPPPIVKNITTVNPTVLANTENVFKPVAISMPGLVEPQFQTQSELTTIKLLNESKSGKQHEGQTAPQASGKNKESPRPANEVKSIVKPTKVPPRQEVNDHRPTTTPSLTSTRRNAPTTVSTLKNLKQPSEAPKGPFYLIIQGHSKVKTYGANKNPINRLLTSNEIKYDEEEVKKAKFERKSRKLRYDASKQDGSNKIVEEAQDAAMDPTLVGEDNLERLEDAFAKSDGGRSKKRYLGRSRRRKRFLLGNRRLLSEPEEDCRAEGRNGTAPPDNLDLESLIAVGDDYDAADVTDILLRDEGSPGSGFGGLAVSVLRRAGKETEDMWLPAERE